MAPCNAIGRFGVLLFSVHDDHGHGEVARDVAGGLVCAFCMQQRGADSIPATMPIGSQVHALYYCMVCVFHRSFAEVGTYYRCTGAVVAL